MPCSFCSVMMMDELVELDVQDGSSGCANPVINPLSKLALPPQTLDGRHSMIILLLLPIDSEASLLELTVKT